MSEMRNQLGSMGPPDDGPSPQRPQLPEGPLRGAGEAFLRDRQKNPFQAQHDLNKAIHNQVTREMVMLDHIRREMDHLVSKGDTVTPQDVIGAAGRVVGHGMGTREMATLLSDMPTQAGQGLAAWLMVHDANIRQAEAQVRHAKALAQHAVGVSAMRNMAANHLQRTAQQRRQGMGTLGPRAQRETGGQAAPPGPTPQVIQMMQAPQPQGAETS